MLEDTHVWWTALRMVAAFNVVAWLAVAAGVWRAHALDSPDVWRHQRWQLLLSLGYVLGCAWRSVFPVFDVPRLVMVDSFWSSAFIGRSVATVAELCFAAQWALLLHRWSAAAGCAPGQWVSRAIVPLIVLAELCSSHAVLTTSNIGHVIEEGLWGLCAVLLAAGFVLVRPRMVAEQRPLLWTGSALAVFYALYMFSVDVPMYWARWLGEEAAGHDALSLAQGLVDASTRWIVTHRWEDWRGEAFWMTTYFSVGVWVSIALVCVPAPRPASLLRPRDPMAWRTSPRRWSRRTVSANGR